MTVPEEIERVNLVIVGDGAVGKTCLLATFATGTFPEEYVPTVFENTVIQVQHKGSPILLQLWDTAGQEDYDRLRPLSYPGSDVALMCYSTVDEASFEAITEKWHEEIYTYIKDVPLILVGTKCDMREDGIPDSNETFEPIPTENGKELSKEIEASAFFETSSKTQYNLKEMFEKAIEVGLQHRRSLSTYQPTTSSQQENNQKSSRKSSGSKRKSRTEKIDTTETKSKSDRSKRKSKSNKEHKSSERVSGTSEKRKSRSNREHKSPNQDEEKQNLKAAENSHIKCSKRKSQEKHKKKKSSESTS